jgi:hypothetical protein
MAAKMHAVLGPSSSERWLSCPGSVVLSRGLPNTSSDYADEGTAAHYLASVCLTCDTDAKEYIGREIVVGEWGEAFSIHTEKKGRYTKEVDHDFTDAVQDYIDYVRNTVLSTNGVLHVEQSLSLTAITGEEGAEGTSDTVIITDDEIIVVDLKFGMGNRVDAEDNSQLKMYALAAVDKYAIIHDFKDARLVIHQPRLNHVSEWLVSLEDLEVFRGRTRLAAIRVNDATELYDASGCGEVIKTGWKEMYLQTSDDGCKWCKAKATCPKLSAKIAEAIDAEFEDLTKAPTEEGGMPTDIVEPLRYLEPEELSLRLKVVGMIEDWCKAVREASFTALMAGVEVPDFKLVQGKKGHRKWTSVNEAETVMKSMRLKVDEMYDLKVISPTTAEKLLKDSPKRWKRLEDIITQSEGGPSVAPASDKRPALVTTQVADEMEDLTDDLLGL